MQRFQLILVLCLSLSPFMAAQEKRSVELAEGSLNFLEGRPEKVEGTLPLCLILAPGSGSEQEVLWMWSILGTEATKRGYLAVVPKPRAKQFFEGGEEDLPALFADLEKRHEIDFDHSIVVGVSNGGRSAFQIAGLWPERFAAVAAAPGVITRDVRLHHLTGMPVWLRIGEKDDSRWIEAYEQTLKLLKSEHARIDSQVVSGAGHVFKVDTKSLFDFCAAELKTPEGMETIEIPVGEELRVTADLYRCKKKAAPTILLCHQAGYSRGEYRGIAPRLQAAGFNVLAIDQRVGRGSFGVPNSSARRSKMTGDGEDYLKAKPDIEAALAWIVANKDLKGPIALWGSSYSSSLVLLVAAEHMEVKRVLSFSPGEYFGSGNMVAAAAKKVKAETLIISPAEERGQAQGIAAALPRKTSTFICEDEILHGSKTLEFSTKKDELWTIVMAFLEELRN